MNIHELISHLATHAPGFAQRLQQAGLQADDIHSLDDLNALPVLRKDDLVRLQAEAPPFGGLLAVAPSSLRRIFQSPGPIYDPEPDRPDYWRWQSALRAAGFAAGDLVLNAFGYHLTPAGAMFEEGLRAIGCTVIAGGIGNQEQQVRLMHDLQISGYVGLPSYLKALMEKAAELGLPLALEKAFFTAEPLPPSLRQWFYDHGLKTARQGYGTAECGNLGYECEAEAGWHIPEDAWIQICDINNGQPLPDGETGEIVVTLPLYDYALIRFGTGDLSSIDPQPCACGRTTPRLMGWQGRVGDAVKVRGMFLHPHQLRDLMSRYPQVTAWQAVVTRKDHKDYLALHVVGADESLAAEIATIAPQVIKFRLKVQPVDSLPPDAKPIRDERSWE